MPWINEIGEGTYYSSNGSEEARAEYERFRGCIAQLLDDETLVGDVEGRWVIFRDGWAYGMATYPTQDDALAFAKQMFRDEPGATYIIVQVDIEAHNINAMEVLASAISDAEGFDLSTTPDEVGRERDDDE